MASNGKNCQKSASQLNQEINEVLHMRPRTVRIVRGSSPSGTVRIVRGSRPSDIPSEVEYERRELVGAHKRLEEIQRAPLADRKEAQARFLKTMRSAPALVGERIGWLLDGHYGMGPMLLARRVLASPRMNRAASLTQLIGAFEWQSSEVMSRGAWKKLTAGEKTRLENAVQGVIADASSEECLS